MSAPAPESAPVLATTSEHNTEMAPFPEFSNESAPVSVICIEPILALEVSAKAIAFSKSTWEPTLTPELASEPARAFVITHH